MEKAKFTFLFSRMQALGRLAFLALGVLSFAYSANGQACNVGCNDDINVTLNKDCSAIVTADMLLEGYECVGLESDDFMIFIVGDDNDDGPETTIDDCGKFIYEIKLKGTVQAGLDADHPLKNWPGCWGYITGEDKTKPYVVECPEDVGYVAVERDVQIIDDFFIDGFLNFREYSCFIESGGPYPDCPTRYGTKVFEVDETDVYTIELQFDQAGSMNIENGVLALYQGAFNPDEPCSNIIGQNDQAILDLPATGPTEEYILGEITVEGRLRLNLPLKEDQEYTLLITFRDCEDVFDGLDGLEVVIHSDGDGLVKDVPVEDSYVVHRRLMCSDVPYILGVDPYEAADDEDYYIARPVFADNCDKDVAYTFKDKLKEEGDCGPIYIERTWSIEDDKGNKLENACVQHIHFARPNLHIVNKPAKTVPIECDELSDAYLDENGHPAPSVTGYPFVVSAFGIHDLNDSYCNVGASYEDISEINVCESTVKIVRQWTIIDWCYVPGQYDLNNSPLINYRQIIKWGDFTAPVLNDEPEDEVIGAGPFACEGTLRIQELDVTDNCSSFEITATVYEVVKVPVVDKYGNETGDYDYEYEVIYVGEPGDLVDKIKLGNVYKIHYDIIDDCDNKTETGYYVEAEDNIEPVAVCDDDLHISIGGDGVGRITARDVDEGSWDNCELAGVWISRKLVDDDLRDAYLLQIYDLTFDDLIRSGRPDKDDSSEAEIWIWDKDGDGVVDDNEPNKLRYKNDMWFTWWQQEQWFICEDVNEFVTIELLAEDVFWNSNVCWLDVLIEDKVAPYCKAPANMDLYCTDLPYGFDPEDDDQLSAMFGDAEGIDNCNATAEQTGKSLNWECNNGTITRTFTATDDQGLTSLNTCQQVIRVWARHEYEIKFPKDASADCNAPSPDTIETKEIGCDLLSVNVYDERFEASGDACYKIKRTYKVINWCEYDGESHSVKVSRDADCDGITGEEDVYVLLRPDEGHETTTYIDRDNNEASNPTTSPCGNGAKGHYDNSDLNPYLTSTGYWEYIQFIKVYDTTPPVIELTSGTDFCSYNNVDCDAPFEITFDVTDFCAGSDVLVKAFIDGEQVDVSGVYPNYSVSGRDTIGSHELEIHAVDGCRNSELLLVPFEIIDCKAPTPICISGLAIELMPTEAGTDADGDGDEDAGAMIIWASDFKVSGLEDCSGPISLSINRVGETPDRTQDNLILTCDDPETLPVEIYAWDSADNPTAVQPDGSTGGANYDHCETYVLVQDNMFGLCGGGPAGIAGLITDEHNETVENVQINLTGGMSTNLNTGANGSYNFTGLETGADYTITPLKDDDYLNGVSTFDLVLLTKHILGTKKLDTPYKLIAADANRSQTISALDLIQFRKLVLSVSRSLPGNSSWRFVPASYTFLDPSNPWAQAFPEVLNYNDLQSVIATGDFVAIKIGDLNGNARPNSTVAEVRSLAGVFNLNVADQALTAGVEYRIGFTAMDKVQGYQFTMNHQGLELISIEAGEAGEDNFGIIEEGVLTASWNGEAKSDQMFTLVVRAKTDAMLSELLSVSSRYTRAEAYGQSDELLDVALTFNGQAIAQGAFELYQNNPNPFQGQTVIGFTLPEATQATIKIHDVTGKTLSMIRGEYAKGFNQVNVNSSDLPAVGVLYYTLETDEFTATRKMVVIGE